MIKHIVFITSLLCFQFVYAQENCIKLDISLTQKVENDGFHRNILWLLEIQAPRLDKWLETKCNLSLRLDVNAGMFVNPDQIADLNRMSMLSAYVDGEVNIETPAHESIGHKAYIFVPEFNTDRVSLSLPIHLRYQRSMITGGFGKVQLLKPSLLASCPKQGAKICQAKKNILGPCSALGDIACHWRNVTYQALFEDAELLVPIGNLDDYPLVSIVTLILGCAGCIYVLSILSTAPL